MSGKSKRDYLLPILHRYAKASTKQKTQIPNEFCSVCNYNRKYAIRLLCSGVPAPIKPKAAGRKPCYDKEPIKAFLRILSVASNMVCSKRLKEMIAPWLPFYDKPLSEQNITLLLKISPPSIDRLLRS